MQLAAFNNNNFFLGHSAMLVNEGLPLYVVPQLEAQHDLSGTDGRHPRHGVQGESDDIRSSLSYKLRRILAFRAAGVLCTDPYVTVDPDLVPLDEVWPRSDVLVIGAPHDEYRGAAGRRAGGRRLGSARWRRSHVSPRSIRQRTSASGERRAARQRRHPGLQRGRGHHALPGSDLRGDVVPVRGRSSSSTRRTTRRCRCSPSTPRVEPRLRTLVNTYGRGPGERDPVRHRQRATPVWSS